MILKVCGMRNDKNLLALQEVHPDWIGLIFHPRSPRYVERRIDHPGDSRLIGVFVDAELEFIQQKVIDFRLDGVQLHGSESPEFCRQFFDLGLLTLKAFSIGSTFSFPDIEKYEGSCHYYLFDTKGEQPGGTGLRFDWKLLDEYRLDTPFLLSGGIGPESVTEIREFRHERLAGVDINSRFEDGPAMKNIHKIKTFRDAIFS